MFYDILIIDDDFSNETVFSDIKTVPSDTSESNTSGWDSTIFPLFLEFNRKHFKVTWTTGEIDDLCILDKFLISQVQYIVCDLHLAGIPETSNNKSIISKIMKIIEELDKDLKKQTIGLFINSKYIADHPNIEVGLAAALQNKYNSKYIVQKYAQKNVLDKAAKKKLEELFLLSLIKEQVLIEHIEIEKILDKKIDIQPEAMRNESSFFGKWRVFKNLFFTNGMNTQVEQLNRFRNIVAHKKNEKLLDLNKELKGKELKGKEINSIQGLSNYLSKLEELKEKIQHAKKNHKTHL